LTQRRVTDSPLAQVRYRHLARQNGLYSRPRPPLVYRPHFATLPGDRRCLHRPKYHAKVRDVTTITPNLPPAPSLPARPRLPSWLRINLPAGPPLAVLNGTRAAVDTHGLHTVCEEARCPNLNDCWSRGTATFMVAGDECTRGCRFCSVATTRQPAPPDPREPANLAAAVARMGLLHVVITVVNRDDLPDGGAAHYKCCVEAVHARLPKVTIELLSSDLQGDEAALAQLLTDTPLAVFAHNVECVPRLDRFVRDPRASFQQSLHVLRFAKNLRPDLWTKSSIMVGLGESDQEVPAAMRQLRTAGVDMLTLGQYLAPGRAGERFLPVDRFVPPEQFATWEAEARDLGFSAVAAGPLVRSSYRAGALLERARQNAVSIPCESVR
jgi:lipoyl synthase